MLKNPSQQQNTSHTITLLCASLERATSKQSFLPRVQEMVNNVPQPVGPCSSELQMYSLIQGTDVKAQGFNTLSRILRLHLQPYLSLVTLFICVHLHRHGRHLI